ncbi:neurexin-4 [Lingula anatina]|uniref:Neurexin-4 n=1 Tax=Lingula anatina TaxID=7574 RepID=A0A1S3JQ33_LINAN|nr:neurexin-4 [Lingula anatina]|eukprot:XP_013412477.1 neurexin-4 [Lingula anatina]
MSSCYEYYMHGFRYSGQFEIDPDGANNGVGPFLVECDMTTTPPGKTIIHHTRDMEESSQILGHEACGSWSETMNYFSVDISTQMTPFVDTIATCSQYAKWRCHGAHALGNCNYVTDRGGTKIPYWAGGNSANLCACGVAGNCVDGRSDCNCNKNDKVLREDEGYFTDKSLLPIEAFYNGDTGHAGEYGYYTIGPLECQPALPSCTEWKRFNSTSGLYWVDPDGGGGVAAFEVYCDMSTTPPTVTFHHDYEDRTHVMGYDPALSYSVDLTYNLNTDQIAAYVDIVGFNCTQYIKYECYGSHIQSSPNIHTAWYDRHGQQSTFWAGGDPDGATGNCACAKDGSCANANKHCNCDSNDFVWRLDEGDITQSDYLPVTMVKVGDTGE